MEKSIVITKDGSHTISIPEQNLTYHSHHGAIQESMHVYIDAGLKYVKDNLMLSHMYIFEMGFGTGLNALLTLIEAEKLQQPVHYSSIELYPLHQDEIVLLNYLEQLNRKDLQPVFQQLHQCEWEKDNSITPFFTFKKIRINLIDFSAYQPVNLIYYDAFGPTAQPELWTKEVFEKLFEMLLPGGLLVTYCSKADVRRAMKAVGLIVKKIPGPWGKREMVRASKASGE
ncbi:MAG: tRNA (5-methylaminomethyl-2-thiouridine)(34)-methyltransferase MnmD [Chitinophagaceae bacterium]